MRKKSYWQFRNDISCTVCEGTAKLFRRDTRTCRDCCNEVKKRWYKNLPEDRKAEIKRRSVERTLKWKAANIEEARRRDKERHLSYRKKSQAKNRDKFINTIINQCMDYDPRVHDFRSYLYLRILPLMSNFNIYLRRDNKKIDRSGKLDLSNLSKKVCA